MIVYACREQCSVVAQCVPNHVHNRGCLCVSSLTHGLLYNLLRESNLIINQHATRLHKWGSGKQTKVTWIVIITRSCWTGSRNNFISRVIGHLGLYVIVNKIPNYFMNTLHVRHFFINFLVRSVIQFDLKILIMKLWTDTIPFSSTKQKLSFFHNNS